MRKHLGGWFSWVQVPGEAACGAIWFGLKASAFPGILMAKEHHLLS